MIDKKIIEFQDEFFKRLNKNEKYKESKILKLVDCLLNYDEEIVELGLGVTGKKLKAFINSIDYNHPNLNKSFSGILDNNNNFAQICFELLFLAEFVKKEKLNHLSPIINHVLLKEFYL